MVRHRHTEHIQLALLPVVEQKGMETFPLIVVWLVMPTWYWLIMLLIMLL